MSEQAIFCRGPRPAKSLRGCPRGLCTTAAFAATALAASLASATPPASAGAASARAALAPVGPKAGEAKTGEAKTGDAKTGDAKAGDAKAGDGWVGPRLSGRFSPSSASVLPPPKREGEQKSSWRQPVGFAGLGVGAALLGAGVYSSVRLNGVESQWAEPGFLAYRASTRSPQDSCDAARRGTVSPQAGAASPGQVQSLCSRATTFEALQYAFYGAGALFGGLGAFLLLSGSPSREAPPPATVAKRSQPPKPSWRLQPNFVRSAATLTLHVRFLAAPPQAEAWATAASVGRRGKPGRSAGLRGSYRCSCDPHRGRSREPGESQACRAVRGALP